MIIRKPLLDAPSGDQATPNSPLRPGSRLLRLWAGVVAAAISASGVSAATSDVDLTARPRAGQVQQVTTVVEVRGELTVNADGQDVRRLPMEARPAALYGTI
jgi:hypothetical protein